MFIVCASESAAGIAVTLDVNFNRPVNMSSLRETLVVSLTNLSFAVDLSSLTVTRKSMHFALTVVYFHCKGIFTFTFIVNYCTSCILWKKLILCVSL